MRITYPTLMLLDWAGDDAASIILRAWSAEAGWILEPINLQVHFHKRQQWRCYQLHIDSGTPHHRVITAPIRWSWVWEKKTTIPLLKAAWEMFSAAPHDPNTLGYDMSELYDLEQELYQ